MKPKEIKEIYNSFVGDLDKYLEQFSIEEPNKVLIDDERIIAKYEVVKPINQEKKEVLKKLQDLELAKGELQEKIKELDEQTKPLIKEYENLKLQIANKMVKISPLLIKKYMPDFDEFMELLSVEESEDGKLYLQYSSKLATLVKIYRKKRQELEDTKPINNSKAMLQDE